MNLPRYLVSEKNRILTAKPQEIFMWNSSFDKFRTYNDVQELYELFPNRDLQRNDVIRVFDRDCYKGFIAAMIWGGINASKPITKGGVDTPFYRLMQEPKQRVVDAIGYAKEKIINGDIVELFTSFSQNGRFKLAGIDAAYFTKLFYFLGEVESRNVLLKPLIWDKWTSNAHCALLLQTQKNVGMPMYLGINKHYDYAINLPSGAYKSKLYYQYLVDFNQWAHELGVDAGRLEEFVFGVSLKKNKMPGNPRIDLWKIIEQYYLASNTCDDSLSKSGRRKHLKESSKKIIQPTIDSLADGSTYYPLQEILKGNREKGNKIVQLSISDIESIIKNPLPKWAFTRVGSYWGNAGYDYHVQKRAWLSQGYRVSEISISDVSRSGLVTFVCQ